MVKSLKAATNGNGAHLVPLDKVVEVLHSSGVAQELVSTVVAILEPRPITIEEASKEFLVPYGTLLRWLHIGHLKEEGRLKFAAPGGGKVLVDANAVEELAKNRPKNGRPRTRIAS